MLEVSRQYYLYDKPCDMRKSFQYLWCLGKWTDGLVLIERSRLCIYQPAQDPLEAANVGGRWFWVVL